MAALVDSSNDINRRKCMVLHFVQDEMFLLKGSISRSLLDVSDQLHLAYLCFV